MINQGSLETIEINRRGGFSVLGVGGVPFVLPFGAALSDEQVANLQAAGRVAALGRRRVAEAIVGHVQRELGVSPELHAAAVEQAATKISTAQRQARERRASQERRAARTANKRVAEPAPSKEVRQAVNRVEEARQDLRRARAEAKAAREALEAAEAKGAGADRLGGLREDANRARTVNWAALATMRELSVEAAYLREAQLDAFWAAQAQAETAELASARGEHVGRGREPEERAALRISSRDGLATLFESGKITAHQYGAGRAYRLAYELAGAGLKIANLNPSGAVGANKHGAGLSPRSAQELQRAYVLARLRQIELAVSGIGDRELRVLRLVAGEGHTIRSLGGSGNAREADAKALVRALEAAVQILAAPVHRGLKNAART